MTMLLGPLDASGRVQAAQQTRVAAFLISAHTAEGRLLAAALGAPPWNAAASALQLELHVQVCREMEIVSLLTRATRWWPDPALAWLAGQWEMAWLPQPVAMPASAVSGLVIDAAAFGLALHTAIRPATILPEEVPPTDPFGAVLRRIEMESGRAVQAQLAFLKSAELMPQRDAIAACVDWRRRQVQKLWQETLAGVGARPGS